MSKLLFILILFASCGISKPISGVVTEVKGTQVHVATDSFRVYSSLPKVGDTVSFTPTVNRKKINSKRL